MTNHKLPKKQKTKKSFKFICPTKYLFKFKKITKICMTIKSLRIIIIYLKLN
jgi:hypothetical protein